MNESSAYDLQLIERALLAEDPQFIAQFRRATQQLGTLSTPPPAGPLVVAVDGTLTSMQAVHWAASQARTTGTDIHIVHAFRWRSYPLEYGIAALQDLSDQAAGQDICRSAVELASAVAPGVHVTAALVSGTAGPAIVHAASNAGLLVMGGSRPSALKKLCGTSALPHVISRVRCCVAVVPEAGPHDMATGSLICVGVAGGVGDTAALAAGLRLAQTGAHRLQVVCAAGAEQATTVALAALRRDFNAPVVERITAKDEVADTLTRLAPRAEAIVCDRSLVAMGAPLRGRAGRRLLREALCPVLLSSAGPSSAGGR
jgi:nucleotide-binding universal stress UspA family protein